MVEKKKTVSKNMKKAKTAKITNATKATKSTKVLEANDTKKIATTNEIINGKNGYKVTIEKVAAIIGLVAFGVLLIGLFVALITTNGKLAMAMIFSLVFVSILLFIVLRLYK